MSEDDFKGAAMKVNFTTSLSSNFRRASKVLACASSSVVVFNDSYPKFGRIGRFLFHG